MSVKTGLYDMLVTAPLEASLDIEFDRAKIGHAMESEWEREVDAQRVAFPGKATASSLVKLKINGIIVNRAQTDEAGNFTFENVRLLPGHNRAEVIAERNALWRKVTARDYMQIVYSPPPSQALPLPVTRKTEIEVGFTEVKINLEATLPKDDLLAADIMTGRLVGPQFIEQVFGYQSVNGYLIINNFIDTVPAFTRSDTTTTVSFSTKAPSQAFRVFPPFGSRLKIERVKPSYVNTLPGSGSLTLTILKDYELKSISPLPDELKDRTAKWSESSDPEKPWDSIEVGLSPKASMSPLRLFQITPSDVLPGGASEAARLLLDMTICIPMVWLLWVLRRYGDAEGLNGNTVRRAERNIRRLLGICFTPIILNLTSLLLSTYSEYISSMFVARSGSRFVQSLMPLGAYALVGITLTIVPGVLFLLLLLLRHSRWAYVLRALLGGLGRAGAWVTLIISFSWVFDWLEVGSYRLITSAILTLFSFAVTMRAIRWLMAARAGASDPAAVRVGKLKAAGLLCLAAVTSYPLNNIFFDIYEQSTWSVVLSYFFSFFILLQNLAPYLLLPIICFLLRHGMREPLGMRIIKEYGMHDDRPLPEDLFLYALGTLLFASYLVGTSPHWFWLPFPFLIALWVFPKLVLESRAKRDTIRPALPQLLAERRRLIARIDSWTNLRQLASAQESLEKNLSSGEISFGDYEKRKGEIEGYVKRHDEVLSLEHDVRIKDAVLALGPRGSDWGNGLWAARRSLFLIIPLLVIYLLVFTLNEIQPRNTYPVLWFCIQVVTFVGDGLIAAFFFGYFFNSIRGTSGLKKGMIVAVSIILCLLPAWVVPLSSSSITNMLGLIFRAGQTFLFFTTLGIWAFDYRNYRDAVGGHFQWKRFAKFGDMPSATAFLSVILTSVGVAVTTVATGQFTSIVTQIIKVAIPNIPLQPPH